MGPYDSDGMYASDSDRHHHQWFADDWEGCTDSDDECEEQNAADDLIKMMEDLWT